ncbi:MAG: iron-containing alcohol dehydrogenase [Clostridia bacterium]|nr:iron-containing alcohol dehydrogenase [Clostridia bacterium]
MTHADFLMPTALYFGEDCLEKGATLLGAAGTHALLVTGKSSARLSGALDDVTALLSRLNVKFTIFDGVTENPPLLTCHEAGKLAAEVGADFVIGIGGGSALDAAKAVAAFAANPTISPKEIYDAEKRKNSTLPIFAVPTTAGTGSEVNNYSVLTLEGGKQKKTFKAADSWPRAAFVNPRYTASMPHATAISTALDAFAHALESYLSPKSTVFSEHAALYAATLLYDVLSAAPAALDDSDREHLSLAATAAGMAISVTGTGFPHPMGYSLTLLDGLPHGRACALFAGDYIRYNERSAQGALRIKEFCQKIGTRPRVLAALLEGLADAEFSFTEAEIATRVELIAGAGNYQNSPYVLSKSEIYDIYRAHFLKK